MTAPMQQASVDNPIGRIAVIGSGSWATALAYLLLKTRPEIGWFVYRHDRIEEFRATGHNPAYLSDVAFDIDRIHLTDNINEAIEGADTIVLATPSPYFKSHAADISVSLKGKNVVSAIKGIVPDENMTISDFMTTRFGVDPARMLAVGGPCHAEEVALERRSYLTVGCSDIALARSFASCLESPRLTTVTSTDIDGIEYSAVLKNIYAIAAGMVNGSKAGDNFLAVLVSNAIREMRRFLEAACPMEGRDVCQSVYLGDLLVTSYSRFSRNHNLGSMLGKGYSVKVAMMEMAQTAEGYFATRCIHDINTRLGVDMPILEGVWRVLYAGASPLGELRRMANAFN